jgi:adenosylcobinamide-GDP ribazoletransferase
MRRALAFLTPLGGAVAPSPSALAWFPVVGAALGLALGGVWWLAAEAWPPQVAAALVVAADLGLTGMLHLDGLVDSADGLIPPLERTRRLDVMADPQAGAFGVGAAVVVVLLRWAALSALTPSALLLGGIWCASRTAMATTTRFVPYARPGGLAEVFRGTRRPPGWVIVGGVAGAAAVAWIAAGGPGILSIGAVLAAGAGVVILSLRRIGGFTGDVLGAVGMAGETAGLLVVAARW